MKEVPHKHNPIFWMVAFVLALGFGLAGMDLFSGNSNENSVTGMVVSFKSIPKSGLVCESSFDCQQDSYCKDGYCLEAYPKLTGYVVATGSCKGACGAASKGCYCDPDCEKYKDCCADYKDYCGSVNKPDPAIPTYSLKSYPEPFVKNGIPNSVIIVGHQAKSDEVSYAYDIASSLKLEKGKYIMLDNQFPNINKYNKNVILIGTACTNNVISQVLGNPENCAEGYEEGKGIIKLVKVGEIYALLIMGYSSLDIGRARQVIVDYINYPLQGTELEVTGDGETIFVSPPKVVPKDMKLTAILGFQHSYREGKPAEFSASGHGTLDGSFGLKKLELWVATVDRKNPYPYKCPILQTGPWCKFAELKAPTKGDNINIKDLWTPPAPGDFEIVVNAEDTKGRCTGVEPKTEEWQDCGFGDSKKISVGAKDTPDAALYGPKEANVGQSMTHFFGAEGANKVTKAELWVAVQEWGKTGENSVGLKLVSPYPHKCRGITTGPWCSLATLTNSEESAAAKQAMTRKGLSRTEMILGLTRWTADKPGEYLLVVNAYDNKGNRCSGSWDYTAGWPKCGVSDSLIVSVKDYNIPPNTSKLGAELGGQTKGTVTNQIYFNLSYSGKDVNLLELWVATKDLKNPYPYVCNAAGNTPGKSTGPWCRVAFIQTASSSPATEGGLWFPIWEKPVASNTYQVVANVYQSNGQRCTGADQLGDVWSDCGPKDNMIVVIGENFEQNMSMNVSANLSTAGEAYVGVNFTIHGNISTGPGINRQRVEIWVATSDMKNPYPYKCSKKTGPWCHVVTTPSSQAIRAFGSFVPTNAGKYLMVVNGIADKAKCTGVEPLTEGWEDCGPIDRVYFAAQTAEFVGIADEVEFSVSKNGYTRTLQFKDINRGQSISDNTGVLKFMDMNTGGTIEVMYVNLKGSLVLDGNIYKIRVKSDSSTSEIFVDRNGDGDLSDTFDSDFVVSPGGSGGGTGG